MTEQQAQENGEAKQKREKKPADQELSALRRVGAILETLSEAGQRRVLGYYADRVH